MRSLGWAIIQWVATPFSWSLPEGQKGMLFLNSIYKKGLFSHTHTHRTSWEDKGRDSGDVPTNQRIPEIANKPPEVGERLERDYS